MIWLQAYLLVGLVTVVMVLKRGLHPRLRQTPLFLRRGHIGPMIKLRYHVVVPFLMGVFLCVAWPVFWVWLIHDKRHTRREHKRIQDAVFRIRPEYLGKATSVAAVESNAAVFDPLGAVPHLPFGHLHGAWTQFINQRPEGAELYPFEGVWVNSILEKRERKGFVWVTAGGYGPFWMTHELRMES
jgi:hypothetical protein